MRPLPQPKPQKRGLIAIAEDHFADGNDGCGRSGAESRGGQAGGEPAQVGKPFERVADASAINSAGTDAGERRGDKELPKRTGEGIQGPGAGHEYAAERHDDARAETVDEPAFDRHQPCFGRDEDAERDLNGGGAPMIFLVDRIDEQRPAILQVGDHHHAEDADHELVPASKWRPRGIGFGRGRFDRHRSRPQILCLFVLEIFLLQDAGFSAGFCAKRPGAARSFCLRISQQCKFGWAGCVAMKQGNGQAATCGETFYAAGSQHRPPLHRRQYSPG